MAPSGEMLRLFERFGENVLRHGSHEWLPYSNNAVCTKSSNSQFVALRSTYPFFSFTTTTLK